MAINRTSPKKGKVVDIPTAPTIGTATAGPESATVAFTAATVGGPISTYTALSNPGSITGTGSSSPITVTGLTAGTAYTFTVRGSNATGSSEYSSASNSITPTVATSYESIATVTVGAGGQSSITFSSIPQTYKHLQIRGIAKAAPTATDTGYDLRLAMNSDTTGSNYECHYMYGTGSATGAGTNTDNRIIGASAGSGNANMFAVNIYDILDYTNTSKNKVVRALCGDDFNGSGYALMHSMLWMNTNAVTSLTFDFHTGASFGQYSSFALYGIKG